jgi:ribosomal protein L12E/L44/L45/RPP1/RPP2
VAEEGTKSKNIDIWLVLVIILMVLSIGGGLYITSQMMLSRLDAIDVRMRSQSQRVESEVFSLRKQVQDLALLIKKGKTAAEAAASAAPAAPAKPPAK